MQQTSSLLSLLLLLRAVAATVELPFTPPNAYNCSAISSDFSDYCCAQIQLFPGKEDAYPGVEVYDWSRAILSGGQVTYGVSEPFYSDLCWTVDVVAAYTSSLDGTEWVDDSAVAYADQRAGADLTAPSALAALDKDKAGSRGELNAAYWFLCGGAPCQTSSTAPAAAAATATATGSGVLRRGGSAAATGRPRSF